jgi:putative endonuclease
MFTVYVLFSARHHKTYVGYTSDLIARYWSHNHFGNTGWTKKYRPWVVAYCEHYETKSDAAKREKELKSGKGRDWIKFKLETWISVFG